MDTKFLKMLMRGIATLLVLTLLTNAAPGNMLPAHAAPGITTRVSVDSSGAQANNYSRFPAISADGRYVAFESEASNLVVGDTNGTGDVFVHDRQTGQTTRVSVDSSGVEANGSSEASAISGDGRYVAFSSYASNLVSGDTNEMVDIFVHDRQTGQTTRVSVDSSGVQANDNSSDFHVAISWNGRYVAFQSDASNLVTGDTNGVGDVFVHDRQTGQTTRVSVASGGTEANSSSSGPDLSDDGRYVAFSSSATNLVSGDTNGKADVFVHDLQTGATTRVSVSSTGVEANMGGSVAEISGDGRYVMFSSDSYNLVAEDELYDGQVYLHDRQTGQTILASRYSNGEPMYTGEIEGTTLSRDGRYIAYGFYGHGELGLMNIWVRDLQMGETIQVTNGGVDYEDSSSYPSLSADGSLVAYMSHSSRLVDGDTNGVTDVFVHEVAFTPNANPTVLSVLQNCPRGCTSPADPVVDYTVTFSESVTGVTADDFVITMEGGITGASVTEILGSGAEYIVAVNTGTGNGTLRLDILDNDSIIDSMGAPLGGTGAGNGNFDGGDVYNVIKSTGAPAVTSITRVDPNPTIAGSVRFTATFSEDVSGADISDFTLTATGSISGASVLEVSGGGTTYTINVNTGTGDGTLRLDITDDDSILNAANVPLGGAGTGNGSFTSGEAYTLDRSAPYVTGSLRADPNPTTAESVNFTITFSESVTGVDAGDFLLTTTGSISGAAITGVSGSGNTYTVIASTGSGEGTLRMDIQDNDSIIDAIGNLLGGAGVGNGNFTTGEEYTVNKVTVPTNLITETLRSNGRNDGWVLESSEDSNQGGEKDSRAITFVLGDDAQNREFRSILHFPTHYLPDNAVITRALLLIKGQAVVGTNPFETHQNILVDIHSGPFGFIGPFPFRGLQDMDFQSPSSMDAVGVIENNPLNGWYYAWIDPSAFQYIDPTGITQIRLRFQLDDDNDMTADYLRFFSGDYDRLPDRPQLSIEYYKQR